jgi:hypothetical protein
MGQREAPDTRHHAKVAAEGDAILTRRLGSRATTLA